MQHIPSEDLQESVAFTLHTNDASGSQSALDHVVQPAQPEPSSSLFSPQDEDAFPFQRPLVAEPENQADQSSPFVLPFQYSGAMPAIVQTHAQGASAAMGPPPSPSSVGTPPKHSRRLVKIVLIASVILATVLGTTLLVFAQAATSPSPPQGVRTRAATVASSPQAKTTPAHQGQSSQNQGGGAQGTDTPSSSALPSAQLLDHIGWAQAGFSLGDAIEAMRTATTFTDREMSVDYRTIGTIARHGGTLTAATFLLTPGGQARFAHHDVRVINNLLYEKVRTEKMIQQVVNAQASLVQLQRVTVQGRQEQFAWANVAFALFQSTVDPASGKRTEHLELDPATGQLVTHHMQVVLLRVPPQAQGANAPMGGTGWLVNTYALDTMTPPTIATTPSL